MVKNIKKETSREELMNLAYERLKSEFDAFKEKWNRAIAHDPSAIFGGIPFEYCIRADILFWFEDNNNESEIIEPEKLIAIINEEGNALDKLVSNAEWVVKEYTEDLRFSVLFEDY